MIFFFFFLQHIISYFRINKIKIFTPNTENRLNFRSTGWFEKSASLRPHVVSIVYYYVTVGFKSGILFPLPTIAFKYYKIRLKINFIFSLNVYDTSFCSLKYFIRVLQLLFLQWTLKTNSPYRRYWNSK